MKSAAITPFRISFEGSIIDDLKRRIVATRWPNESNSAWVAGSPVSYLNDLLNYWESGFDWRKAEQRLNAIPNYMAKIDGYDIHFLYLKSEKPDAIPLIITHGWPGSIVEMLKIVPLLTANGDVSFDVVIPSVPGYGFSSLPPGQDVSAIKTADLWVKLMDELGYSQFVTQGGDFGAFVSVEIARRHPDRLLGLHLNYIPFTYKPFLSENEKLTDAELAEQKKTATFFQREGAYAQIQTTKPLMLSYAINDSPAGLASWILEMFKGFSDQKKTPEELFDRDELLTHISLYWFTQCFYSSITTYRNMMREPIAFKAGEFVSVPTGIAKYPFPDSFPARKYIERGFNVRYWNEPKIGGHFAAMEEPKIFADDLKAFVESILILSHR